MSGTSTLSGVTLSGGSTLVINGNVTVDVTGGLTDNGTIDMTGNYPTLQFNGAKRWAAAAACFSRAANTREYMWARRTPR